MVWSALFIWYVLSRGTPWNRIDFWDWAKNRKVKIYKASGTTESFSKLMLDYNHALIKPNFCTSPLAALLILYSKVCLHIFDGKIISPQLMELTERVIVIKRPLRGVLWVWSNHCSLGSLPALFLVWTSDKCALLSVGTTNYSDK